MRYSSRGPILFVGVCVGLFIAYQALKDPIESLIHSVSRVGSTNFLIGLAVILLILIGRR
ncbi:hypothetical protein DSAG12_00826 [Promethearchaeum syntrophicum]|uniref:Uncharacterized protein n=1 Tax=Promethearchaeum syntrophicum TaxID=2594042 RepID=A0A5B9D7L0_9ARCH|nr:hypothetical protein [Candidatus Prometheoarchaeum syntrophicum]QEE15003.1 hypothetical protein DSAG12_00826 [Candidatus Prometheoarchaeum syntrophicum]